MLRYKLTEVAERTGLEPATPGVTGRLILNREQPTELPLRHTKLHVELKWRSGRDSNPQPPA